MDWYPFYFTKYKQDTMHLNPYQDGCYRRLIDHYMQTRAPLPDNDAALARIVGDSLDGWLAYGVAIVRPFFQARNGLLFHKKCEEVLKDQNKRLCDAAKNGKKGAEKRWSKIKEIDSPPIAPPIGTPMGSDSTVQYSTYIDTKVSISPLPPKKKTHDHEFEVFWAGWKPYDMDRGSKQNALKFYQSARKETTHENIIAKRDQYLANCHSHGRRTTHASTWLNPTGRRGWADEYEPIITNNPAQRTASNIRRNADDLLRDRVNATAREIDNLIGDKG